MLTALAVARLGLRRRLGTLAALAVLVAVVTGVVVGLAGGARRTVSTIDRLRDMSRGADLYVQPFEATKEQLEQVRALTDVEAAGERALAYVRIAGTDLDLADGTIAAAAADDQYLRAVDRPRVLDGRLPDPDAVAEIAVTESAVDEFDLAVGDVVAIESLTPEQTEAFVFDGAPIISFAGPRLEVEVTGVVRPIDDALGLSVDRLLFTPAFWERYGDVIGGFDGIVLVRARAGADLAALTAELEQIWPTDSELAILEVAGATTALRDVLRTQAIGLAVAAVSVGIAGLVVVTQALRRSTSDDDLVLRTIGLTRRQRAVVAAVPLMVTVAAGIALALVSASLLSGLFPRGPAARIEPSPGIHGDVSLLAIAGLVALLVAVTLVMVIAIEATRPSRSAATPGRLARAVSRGPVVASAAAHLAARRGVPARPALAGAVVALAGAVAAAVFGASLTQLVEDPARDGWGWDAEVGLGDGLADADARAEAKALAARTVVAAVALARYAQLEVAGKLVQIVGIEPVEGQIDLLALTGRVPRALDEVALGSKTADALQAEVGDRVELRRSDGTTRPFTVTGLVRFPNVADEDPANGVTMTLEALANVLPPDPEFGAPGFPTTFVRWKPDADALALEDDLRDEFNFVDGPRASSQVGSLGEVRGIAPMVVALLAVLGLAAVVHALLVSVRRAHRDIGVLAALGFRRRQRGAVVLAQALGYFGAGLIVGVPLGVVVGRWTWSLLARQLRVADDAAVPVAMWLALPITLLVALLAAAWPALLASRLRPASALRTE